MKLIDTNIIIYAVGRPHPYKEPCARILRDASADADAYTIDAEVLQELLHVYTMRAERSQALQVFDRSLALFPNPLLIGRPELVRARDLMEQHTQLSARDALHAAVVMTCGLEGIVTTDRGFRVVAGLQVFDPAEAERQPKQ